MINSNSQVAEWSKICWPTQEMQEAWVRSLGREDLLDWEMVTHSSVLAWEIPWTEDSGGLQSTGLFAKSRI